MPDGAGPPRALILACGALAREIRDVTAANGWDHVDMECLPATLHNTPDAIPGEIERRLPGLLERYDRVLVGYADCGTGGLLDAMLDRYASNDERVERLPGAHCYEFFAGAPVFAALHEEELGTFYLTDFLVKHFDRMVWRMLGLDRHPELRDTYFANYRRVVYLSQTADPELVDLAAAAAARLELAFEHRPVGYGEFAISLEAFAAPAAREVA